MADVYDTEMEEVKELVKRQGVQIDEMHKMIRGMRRAQRLHMLWSLVWWVAVLGVSAWAYYAYLWPYVVQLQELYGSAQGWDDQIAQFFSNFRPGETQ